MSAARWKAFARRYRISEIAAAALLLAAILALVHRIYAPPPAAKPKPDRVLRIRIVNAPPPAAPSPVANCREALKAPERVEALPLPKEASWPISRYLHEEDNVYDDENAMFYSQHAHDPCGGEVWDPCFSNPIWQPMVARDRSAYLPNP